jgi:hypothetical protein
VGFLVQYWQINGVFWWPTQVGDFWSNIGKLGGVSKWPTQMDKMFGAILVDQVG